MLKLLNRFAWLISITIGIAIFAISEELFFPALIVIFIIKFLFLSENFIEERLKFFADSINKNYLNNSEFKKEETENQEFKKEIIEEKQEEVVQLVEDDKIIDEKIEYNIEEETVEEKEKNIDLQNSIKYTQYNDEPWIIEIFFEKIWSYIKEFFSTNILAKLWWILVFLAVVYFLKGFVWELWEIIGPLWRIIVWIIIWFITFFVWFKLYSNSKNEGLILMWTWILINFAVILSWRYLIWDNWYLSDWTTFIFLILNTVFWVLTSLLYNSKTLLIFSFIFAYLNPFIIWADSTWEPYTLIWYSFIVSIWALYLSFKNTNLTLLVISFIFWNILFLVAPFSDSIWWSSKIILTSIFSILSIITASKFSWVNFNSKQAILYLFSGSYFFIILNLLNSTTSINGEYLSILSSNLWAIIYNLIILWLFAFTIKIIKSSNQQGDFNHLNLFLFVPLLILLWILFSWNLIFAPFVLIWTLIIYLIAFSFLNITWILAYLYFGILSIFILLNNLSPALWILNFDLNKTWYLIMIITSFIFLFSSYYYSTRKYLTKLFSIWTIWSILILAPIIVNKFIYLEFGISNSAPINILEFNLSILAILIFAIVNLILPFINKNLLKKENLNTLIIWSLAWALFFAFQIYSFWEIHFPWLSEWLAFLALAIVYFTQWFLITNKLWLQNIKKDENLKNIIFTFLWISISIFSVAIAFIFSKYPEVVSSIWLFEATILYFFYSQNWNKKIFLAATILFIIWLTKFWILLDIVEKWDFQFLISFWVILSSFMLNLFFINKIESKEKNNSEIHNIHNFIHIIWMWIMWLLLLQIIPSSWHWWSLFWISIFITLLWSLYAKFNYNLLKIVFIIVIWLFWIFNIWSLNWVFYKLQRDDLEYLKILQYIVTAIIISNIFIWKKFSQAKNLNKILLIIISIYSFIISNIFIIDLFWNIFWDFTLTIYWWLIASSLLMFWISKDLIKYRTIWLYFLALTSVKIFSYDVWQIWDTNSRVAVFAILWVIFIIISTLYTKRFWDNLLWEFSLSNLKDEDLDYNNEPELKSDDNIKIEKKKKNKKIEKINISPKDKEENSKNTKTEQDKKLDNSFMVKLKKVEIDDIKVIRFYPNKWEDFRIRAKNLIKIVKIIIKNTWKNNFKAWELDDIYKYVVKNYKTDLSRREYNKIRSTIKDFIDFGGEVEIVKK